MDSLSLDLPVRPWCPSPSLSVCRTCHATPVGEVREALSEIPNRGARGHTLSRVTRWPDVGRPLRDNPSSADDGLSRRGRPTSGHLVTRESVCPRAPRLEFPTRPRALLRQALHGRFYILKAMGM